MKRTVLTAGLCALLLPFGAAAATVTWSGEKIIEEPVNLSRTVLKVLPGAKIVFFIASPCIVFYRLFA